MKTLFVRPDIAEAVRNKEPVVALESTIISHGMPYPQNVETALMVENIVRENGAIPATIGVFEGQMIAGLDKDQIRHFGQQGEKVTKVSRRDLPFVLAQKKAGATTVAGTMIIAARANIRFFATGGIGGVHKGAQQTFDISADLYELAQTDVAVVSAGIKSILDLGLTLEYLETLGVPVIGYQTDTLPAFYARESPFDIPIRLDSTLDIANTLKAKWNSNLSGGVLIANPVPKEFALPYDKMEKVIANAITDAEQKGIKGKALTPFLLAQIKHLTKGDSLVSNIELVKNNAKLTATIARIYAGL